LRKLTRAFDLAKQSTEKRFSENAVAPDSQKPVTPNERPVAAPAAPAAATPPPKVDTGAKGGDITIRPEDLLN
jgi:hypothetical protein